MDPTNDRVSSLLRQSFAAATEENDASYNQEIQRMRYENQRLQQSVISLSEIYLELIKKYETAYRHIGFSRAEADMYHSDIVKRNRYTAELLQSKEVNNEAEIELLKKHGDYALESSLTRNQYEDLIREKEGEIELLKKQKEELDKQIYEYQTKIELLMNQKEEDQTKIELLNNDYQTKIELLKKRVDEYQTKIELLKNEKEEDQTKIELLNNQINEYQTKIELLKKQVDDDQTKIELLKNKREKRNANNQTEIELLKKQQNEDQTKIELLEKQRDTAVAEVHDLKEKNKHTTKEKNRHSERAWKLEKDLKQAKDNLETSKTEWESKLADMKNQRDIALADLGFTKVIRDVALTELKKFKPIESLEANLSEALKLVAGSLEAESSDVQSPEAESSDVQEG